VARVADQAARLELQDVVRSILRESEPNSPLGPSGSVREGVAFLQSEI